VSIAKLKHLNLVADAEYSTDVLSGLQSLGVVHLVPLVEAPASNIEITSNEAQDAMRYLLDSPMKRRLQRPTSDAQLSQVLDDVIRNRQARSDILDEIELIHQHRKALAPWGQFEFPDLEALGNYRLWFYTMPPSKSSQLKDLELPWQVINSDHKHLYFVVVAQDEPSFDQVPYPRSHTGADSLETLAQRNEDALIRLEEISAEREALTRWILPLRDAINAAHDAHDRSAAQAQCLIDDSCIALSAWIPEQSLTEFKAWAKANTVAYELSDPDPEEPVPTLLQNNDWFGGGEEAVGFFQMPGYRTWDPSPVVFCSFALFFAMILADAGYALLLGAVVYFLSLSADKTNRLTRRILNMSWVLVGSSVVFGALVGSYFGVEPETGILAQLHVLDMQNYLAMMKFSIGIGVLHIAFANMVVAWRKRGQIQAFGRGGWSLLVLSCFAMWLEYLSADDFALSQSLSVYPASVGFALIILCSGSAGFGSPKAVAQQLAEGFKSLYDISKAFGDILSYMRLFALGLSSASLAVTFNSLAVNARDSLDNGGVIVFIIILLLGHGLNLLLGLMSGVIHGLRLNLLEFYNWGIEGEGFAFKPFKKRGD